MVFITVNPGLLQTILGLTPRQRWDAITTHHSQPSANQAYIGVGLALILLLMIWLLVLIHRRKKTEKQLRNQPQLNSIKEKDLTDREHRLLVNMAESAGLKQSESIFTLPTAFNRAAASLIKNTLQNQGKLQAKRIEAEVTLLREKLGFEKFTSQQSLLTTLSGKHSSYQISANKTVFINRFGRPAEDLEAVVIANKPEELVIKLKEPVQIEFGQSWACRYYIEGFVAEFQTTPLRCSERMVAIRHNSQCRIINRRRFMRVPVNNPAYVALFPFKKELGSDTYHPRRKLSDAPASQQADSFSPPTFTHATVCEIGGPGLRIETELEVKVGDRLLLIFTTETGHGLQKTKQKNRQERIIEGIVRVRHVTKNKDALLSVAIEFENLNEHQINELVKTANLAMIRMDKPDDLNDDSEKDVNLKPDLQTV